MQLLVELLKAVLVIALLATTIFHPLCVLALMSISVVYYLGELKAHVFAIMLHLKKGK